MRSLCALEIRDAASAAGMLLAKPQPMAVPAIAPQAFETEADAAPEARIGETLSGTYRITKALERGGMGLVYRAEHLRLKRPVAVKVMSAALRHDELALARFRREADVISQLVHPHIVQVVDYDTTARGEPYLVMELLRGETLADRLISEGRLAATEAVRIITQVASALRCAHDAGVVHRDLKPSNVFLVELADEPAFVKLLDFGISKQARSSTRITRQVDVIGTPDYMSPEQATGRSADVDHRADQFSLAVITYELMAGRHPFWDADVTETVYKIINEIPPTICERTGLPSALDDVLQRALAKDPAERYENVSAFAAALARALGLPSTRPSMRVCTVERKVVAEAPTELAMDTPPPSIPTPSVVRTKAPVCDVMVALFQAERALEARDLDAAVARADLAMQLADRASDPASLAAIGLSRALLERIFVERLGDLRRQVCVGRAPTSRDGLSSREAFLLSRVDTPTTLQDLLEVSAMPRDEAMRLAALLLLKELLITSDGAVIATAKT